MAVGGVPAAVILASWVGSSGWGMGGIQRGWIRKFKGVEIQRGRVRFPEAISQPPVPSKNGLLKGFP